MCAPGEPTTRRSRLLVLARETCLAAISSAIILSGCETSKPEGGLARTSATKPPDEKKKKEAAQPAAPADDDLCDRVVEHGYAVLIKEAPQLRENFEKQRDRTLSVCKTRWNEEYKKCILAAQSKAEIDKCQSHQQPQRPPAQGSDPKQPDQPKAASEPECREVANHVVALAAKSPEITDEMKKQLPNLGVTITRECVRGRMPEATRACLLKATTDKQMMECSPQLLVPPKKPANKPANK